MALVAKNPPANTGYIRDLCSIPVMCLYMDVCVYFKLFSTLGYYKILQSLVPCPLCAVLLKSHVVCSAGVGLVVTHSHLSKSPS